MGTRSLALGVVEDGTYEPFFETFISSKDGDEPVRAIANWEVRDLIYLILNFKETVKRGTQGQPVHTTFDHELTSAIKSEAGQPGALARLRFPACPGGCTIRDP